MDDAHFVIFFFFFVIFAQIIYVGNIFFLFLRTGYQLPHAHSDRFDWLYQELFIATRIEIVSSACAPSAVSAAAVAWVLSRAWQYS
jgi:hypothetical protein